MTSLLTLADLSTKLVELENHPGREHLRRYSPTGVTALRWALVEAALGQLWNDLTELERPDPAALRELQRRIGSALQRVRNDEALAQGLLDRRTELKGRLKAYEAKAGRLGLANDPELLSSRRFATGLLSRLPCDLRSVTQAIVDYQQMLAEKREKTR